MKIYIATYDLVAPDGDYEGVEAAMSECAMGEVLHIQKSVWLLASSKTAKMIRDVIALNLNAGDKVFVTKLDVGDWAGWGTKAQAWIAEHRDAEPT